MRDAGLRRVLLYVCVWKLCLLGLTIVFAVFLPWFFNVPSWQEAFHVEGVPGSLETRLSTWDSQLFMHVASNGYSSGAKPTAMYPLWPALIWAGGGSVFAAVALSHLCFVAACALLYRWVEPQHGPRAAAGAVLALTAYPGAFFFGLPYSEALFLLLGVGLLVALDRREWALAAAVGALLPLTRAVGILALVPIAWSVRRGSRGWSVIASPLLGFAVYLAWMHVETGNAFIGFEAQKVFSAQAGIARIFDPLEFAVQFFRVQAVSSYHGGLIDRIVFVGFLALLWPVYRLLGIAAVGWTVALGLVSAVTMDLTGFVRYAAVLFPTFVVAGIYLSAPERRLLGIASAAVALAFQALLFVMHTSNLWVG